MSYQLDEQGIKLVCAEGFEPSASSFQTRHSNQTELHTDNLVDPEGFEPSPYWLKASCAALTPWIHFLALTAGLEPAYFRLRKPTPIQLGYMSNLVPLPGFEPGLPANLAETRI